MIDKVVGILIDKIAKGGKILVCGNGGSAAEAQHFTAELVNGMTRRDTAFPAICLNSDVAVMTAIGNDRGYHNVFSQQIKALGKINDVLILISTSGSSPNIVNAAIEAEKIKMATIGLFGLSAVGVADVDNMFYFPDLNIQQIQERHLVILHKICEGLENSVDKLTGLAAKMFENKGLTPGFDMMARAKYQKMMQGIAGI